MMSVTDPIEIEQNDGVATLSLRFEGPSRFHLAYIRSLTSHIRRLSQNPHVKIILIRTDNQQAFSDGYSHHLAHRTLTESDRIAFALAGQQLATMLKTSPVVTIAEIKGRCHGPGWELALACDYRLAIATPQTTVGFPETRYGLFPAWGGISELVAKLGPTGAKRLLTHDETLSAREAERCGLIDFVCCERRANIERRTILDRLRAKPRKARRNGFLAIRRHANALPSRFVLRPFQFEKPLDSLIRAARASRPQGLAAERICFASAVASIPVAAAFAIQKTVDAKPALSFSAINPIPPLPHVVALVGVHPEVHPCIVPLATQAVLAGCRLLVEPESSCAKAVHDDIQHSVRCGKLTPLEAKQASERILPQRDHDDWDRAGLVFRHSLSKDGLAQVESMVPPRCLIASIDTNLSMLQERALRPGRIVGLRTPVPTIASNLFELSNGPETTADSHCTLAMWIRQLGGQTVRGVNRTDGVTRRVLYAYWDEAIRLVSEGMSAQLIDSAVRNNGTRMGPFEQIDELGFDNIGIHVKRLIPLMAAGMLGRGTGNGHGFYRYKRGIRTREYHAACSILWDARAIAGDGPLDPHASLDMLPADQALTMAGERLTMRIVNEAMNGLLDDRLTTPAEMDYAIAVGADLLPFAGGPIRFADRRGLSEIVNKLSDFASRIGSRFMPSPRLVHQVAMGQDFYTSHETTTVKPFALRAA